mmetsp:Transcript_17739/g.49212  ORF Transcript_17739/g.49212 Transcript_17739/m.49212 type:complete len:86 (+) Transcript_17739:121-378(+)
MWIDEEKQSKTTTTTLCQGLGGGTQGGESNSLSNNSKQTGVDDALPHRIAQSCSSMRTTAENQEKTYNSVCIVAYQHSDGIANRC